MKKVILLFFAFYSMSVSQTGWQIQSSSLTRNIVSLYIYPNGNGIALGDNGLIFKTTNFGTNWNAFSQFPVLSDYTSYCITALSNDTLIGVQSSGILRSTNGGVNWSYVSSGAVQTQTSFFSVSFGNKRRGFACGVEIIPPPPPPPALPPTAYSLVHYTTNGGVNWTRISNFNSVKLYDCKMTDSVTGYTAGTDYYSTNFGSVFKTTNGGMSFSYASSGFTQCNSVFFANNYTGWAGGNSGFISKTSNGGVPWTMQVSHTANKINSMYFINSSTGWLIGNTGTIRKTTNGGINWNTQYCPVTENLRSIYFIDSVRGWIGTNNGKILYTSDAGGITNMSRVSENVPEQLILYQNFPNPFNPLTDIRYSLPEKSFVRLAIYDALGREIETLVEETINRGLYSVTWNASALPSGIYLCKLQTNNYLLVKKMILIK